MKLRKAIKRIVALGIGASMLGATVLSATAAADLNDYPAPFVQNGKFSGTLVVGDNAAAQDVVGVSDIAMSLQYAASVKAGTGAAATTIVEGDAYEVKASGNSLNLYENLTAVKSGALGADDLNALADGSFKAKTTESYVQKLYLGAGAAQVQYTVYDLVSEDPALYLKFPAGSDALLYELDFNTQVESDNATGGVMEDFEDQKISILGREYTVTNAVETLGKQKLTLMSGAVQDTLEVGQTKTYTINGVDYEVTVMIVSGDTSATAVTKLIVNDEVTKSLSKDDTFTLKDGNDLGIKEILPTKSGDVVQNLVEFFLGAEKIVLDASDNTLDIGQEASIIDTVVNITPTNDASKIDKISIVFTPGNNLYVPAGGKLSESAALEDSEYALLLDTLNVDYSFEGLAASAEEEVEIKRDSDTKMALTFTNINGNKYKVPAIYIADATSDPALGESAAKPLINTQTNFVCENQYFIVEDYTAKSSQVMKLRSVKNTTNTKEVVIEDIGSLGGSSTYSFSDADPTIAFSEFQATVINSTCLNMTKIVNGAGGTTADLWTRYGSLISLNTNVTGDWWHNITITEDEDKQEDDDSIDRFAFDFAWETGSRIDFDGSVDLTNVSEVSSLSTWDSKDDYGTIYTKWGTFIEEDSSGDQVSYKITIPEKEAIAKVYVTSGVTSITSADTVEGETRIINKIDVGATKLASEVAGLETSQNLILVGGPCANAAVEAASSEFPTCSGWDLEAGQAIIQLAEQDDGSVALLVAGTMAADTRTATKVVSEMDKLQALADGVTKQLVEVVSGQEVLTDVPEVVEAAPAEEPAEPVEPAEPAE